MSEAITIAVNGFKPERLAYSVQEAKSFKKRRIEIDRPKVAKLYVKNKTFKNTVVLKPLKKLPILEKTNIRTKDVTSFDSYKIIYNNDTIIVKEVFKATSKKFDSVFLDVKDDRPINSGCGTGGNIRDIFIECQMMNYIEFTPVFSTEKIMSVRGLPIGVILKDNRIKGTPVNSGSYNPVITLTTGETFSFSMEVTPLQRVL